MPASHQELAAEQEHLIQLIAWELFDPASRSSAEFPGPVGLSDDRRRDIIDMLRGFRVMSESERRRTGHLVRTWRSLEDQRDALPGPKLMHLRLEVPGASHQQLSRGLKAAAAVFAKAEVLPHVAARQAFTRQLQDDQHCFNEESPRYPRALTDEEHRLADVWDEADEAAVSACCAGWVERPLSSGLSLIRNLPSVRPAGPYIEFEAA